MARRVVPLSEKQVRKNLLDHLEREGLMNDIFQDVVNQYISLWSAAELYQEDIKRRGVSYKDFSSTGTQMWKNNPSVSELVKVSTQMQKLRKELGFEPHIVSTGGGDDDDL